MKKIGAACWAMAVMTACSPPAGPATTAPRASDAGGTPTLSRASQAEIRVTRDSHRGPEPCRPARVGDVVATFLDGFSAGDPAAAQLFVEDMEWYSMSEWSRSTGKRHFVTHDRAGLERYIERRSTHGERMVLLEVRVQFDGARDLGHIAYTVERTADDFPRRHPIVMGKGAVDCGTGRILLLSMGHDVRYQDGPEVCPGTAQPPDIALACGAS